MPDIIINVFCASVFSHNKKHKCRRKPQIIRKKINLDEHFDLLEQENEFQSYYCMSISSFDTLFNLFAPVYISQRNHQINVAIDRKSLQNKLQLTISWLAGGHFQALRAHGGLSRSSFYQSVDQVMEAIIGITDLRISFPSTNEEALKVVEGFRDKSTNGLFDGCVGAIDGWLCPILRPTPTSVNTVIDFFSGHYQKYGINVQLCCDSLCRFTEFSVSNPGSRADHLAYKNWGLSTIVKGLNNSYYIIADNAYVVTPYLMTPFDKLELKKKNTLARDSFNFYLSQLRIRIEMAIGILVNKWRIFKKQLEVNTDKCKVIIHTEMCFHNFIVNEKMLTDMAYCPKLDAYKTKRDLNHSHDLVYLESTPHDKESNPKIYLTDESTNESNNTDFFESLGSLYRDFHVELIGQNNMHRPQYNINRNRNNRNLI